MSRLIVQSVHFRYPNGFDAVRGVSFELAPGEKLAIIGENGAGKTTMTQMLCGLKKPSSGDILLDGHSTALLTTAQTSTKVGYVFQNPDDQLFSRSVFHEIALALKYHRLSSAEVKKRVEFASELCGVSEFLEENPYDLPLQSRKFVAIAIVVAMSPAIYIFDEPTAGQDRKAGKQLSAVIDYLTDQGGSVITISHDMDYVARIFPNCLVMAHGEILFQGSCREAFGREDDLATASLEPPAVTRLAQKVLSTEVLTGAELIDLCRIRTRQLEQTKSE